VLVPGRNPQQAVAAFLDPFREALRVLDGVGKLSLSPKGGYRLGQRYSWQLNGAEGMDLGPVGLFIASMEFEVVDADPGKNEFRHPYRVTTGSYHYKLRGRDGKDQWRIHWHPDGRSRVRVPHIHRPPDLKQHWPTGRMTFENAVAWCIESGAAVRGGDNQQARNQLAVIEAPHLLYRSWN
jgi:hypothetical protein